MAKKIRNKTIKLLCLFDYNSHTGFSTVSKNLISNWQNTFGDNIKIDIVAVNYFGESYKEGNVTIVSAKHTDIAKDDFGRYVFMRSLRQIDYDVIFILQDTGVIAPIIPFLRKILQEKITKGEKQFKSIFYFPVDFELLPYMVKDLDFFDYLATFTEFGKRSIINWKPELSKKINIVPHGNNSNNFYPLPNDEIKTFRKEYFGDNSDKFIVGCVNRNQFRKDIPTTIFGFMEFWETNKNSFLYLHFNPSDPMGWDVKIILNQTPLKENIDYQFPTSEESGAGTSIKKLNCIYNSLDCYLSTALGGGWELTTTESMAVRVPTIVPKHTSFLTLGGKSGENTYFLENQYPIVSTMDNIIRFQCDLYEIADKLTEVKNDILNGNVKKKTDAAYNFVSGLKWKDIAKVFSDKIKELS
jgi:glycosyltransferase involved in cell wall biosynthesis